MASRTSSHCFLLAIALFTACLQGSVGIDLSLRFIKEPEDVFAKRNQPVVLDCSGFSSSEYGPVNVTWYHKGVLVNDARRQILTNGSLYIRKVRYKKHNGSSSSGSSSTSASVAGSADVSEAGVYHCAITNGEGTLVSRPAHLYIATMSKKFSQDPKSVMAEEGDVVQFRCQIQAFPVPTYFWQRDQNTSHDGDPWITILPQVDGRFTVLPAGVLQINRVVASDAGKYRCMAHNIEHNQSSAEAVLQVTPSANKMYHPPQFLNTETVVSFRAGDTAILECLATGYPNPTIQWARQDGRQMHTKVTSISGQGNLVLHSVNVMDDGTYVCTASNKNPHTMETRSIAQVVQLRVLMSPKFLKLPQSVVHPLGKTARFECEVQGYPPPTVRWLKDGQFIEIYGRIKQKNISSNELVILLTVKADSGIYQCVADSSAGYGSAAARLVVSTSRDQPDPPTNLSAATRTNVSIELTWNPAVSRNGLPIRAYTVHYMASGGQEMQQVCVNTSCVVGKLMPYTNYTFYVRAYNDKSASEQSESVTWTTGEDIPIAAPSVTLTSSMTSLHVTWDELPPYYARGVITKYKIQWRKGVSGNKHDAGYYDIGEVPGYVREYTITGLSPGKKYDARVLAATKMGFPNLPDEKWPWVTHEMPNHTALYVPSAPYLEHEELNATTLKLTWKKPEENEFQAIGYNISYQKQNHTLRRTHIVSGNVTNYIITDLEPNSWYEVRVFGFNRNGNGRETVSSVRMDIQNDGRNNTTEILLKSVLMPPSHLEAYSTDPRVIHLKWQSPRDSKNISFYTVRYNAVHNTTSINSSTVSYITSVVHEVKITDLVPYTQYEFSVRSHVEKNVFGPFSTKVECKTWEDVPTAPRDLRWHPLNANTVRLTWQPPLHPNGVIISYDIMYHSVKEHNNSFDKWYTIKEQGTELSSLVSDLESNTLYYLCMRAETRAGAGPATDVLAFNIPILRNSSVTSPSVPEGELQDPKIGIILGVTIGIFCIIICGLIIVFRNRCFPQPHELHIHSRQHPHHWGNGYVTRVNNNGYIPREYRISSSESHEMDSITPMLGLTQIPETISSHLDSKGGYAMCVPYLGGHSELNGGPTTHYSNGHAGQQQLLINITENPQFEIGNEIATDANKRTSQPFSTHGSPSSSAPLLDGSSGQNSVSSDGNQNHTVAAFQEMGNHTHDQSKPNSHSQRNGHHVQQHHTSNGNHHRHHHHHHHHHHCHTPHNQSHSHSEHLHGAKRSKRNNAGVASTTTLNGGAHAEVINPPPSVNAHTPLHSSTQDEVQSAQVVTSTSAVVIIPPGNSKHSSKDGRRRRPLSHTAISAVPNSVGTSCSQSSPSMITTTSGGGSGSEQRLAASPKSNCHSSGSEGGGGGGPQHTRSWQSDTQHQPSQSFPSSTSPSSSTSSSSSSSTTSSSSSATQPVDANSHKSMAPV